MSLTGALSHPAATVHSLCARIWILWMKLWKWTFPPLFFTLTSTGLFNALTTILKQSKICGHPSFLVKWSLLSLKPIVLNWTPLFENFISKSEIMVSGKPGSMGLKNTPDLKHCFWTSSLMYLRISPQDILKMLNSSICWKFSALLKCISKQRFMVKSENWSAKLPSGSKLSLMKYWMTLGNQSTNLNGGYSASSIKKTENRRNVLEIKLRFSTIGDKSQFLPAPCRPRASFLRRNLGPSWRERLLRRFRLAPRREKIWTFRRRRNSRRIGEIFRLLFFLRAILNVFETENLLEGQFYPSHYVFIHLWMSHQGTMFLSDLLLLFIYQLLRESVGEYVNNQLLCLDLVFLCQIIDFLTRNDL